jgi:putative transposase
MKGHMKGFEKFEPDSYYHIVNHAVGSEQLFRSDENYRYFLQKYARHMTPVCATLAYCLMPNHIHFLIKTHSEKTLMELPKFKGDLHKLIMQQLSNLLNAYAKAYNKKYARKGALWIDYSKRFKITSNHYLTAVINYIPQNPVVHHGFVSLPTDWNHSSYFSHVSAKQTLLSRKEVIDWFGGMDAYVKFHKESTAQLMEDWEY